MNKSQIVSALFEQSQSTHREWDFATHCENVAEAIGKTANYVRNIILKIGQYREEV